MTEKRYDISYSGRCVDGADAEEVRLRLAKLLKIDAERLAPLFAGRRGVIRKGLDADKARQYKAAFEKAGAIPEISVSNAGPPAAGQPAASAPEQTAAAAKPGRPPRAPDFTVAEPGATLVEPKALEAPDYDLSGLDLAEPGVDLVEYRRVDPPEYDLSDLVLDPPGTDLSDAPRPEPANFDTSGLSLADND